MTQSTYRTLSFVCLNALLASLGFGQAMTPDPETPLPFEAKDTVFMEEMTWIEVREAMRSGKTNAIIATGGVEQNGPYLDTNKHQVILQATTDRIARKLGNALVAPIVQFVPEGDIDPPSGHMLYPGTISVSEETFKALLADIANSLRVQGFENILLIGDSGGNQTGMAAVAEELSKSWKAKESSSKIHYIKEYYDNPRWAQWVKDQGIEEVSEGIHDDVRHASIMLLVDPDSVRLEQRKKAGLASINGVSLVPAWEIEYLANRLVDYQADITVEAIKAALK